MKAFEQYFYEVIMLYTVAITFTSVDQTLVCDHSNESYRTLLLCGAIWFALCILDYSSAHLSTSNIHFLDRLHHGQ